MSTERTPLSQVPGAPTGVSIRELQPTDGPALGRMLSRSSAESIQRRFFTGFADPPAWLVRQLTQIDDRTVALGAFVDGELIGEARVARYATEPRTAELAVMVEDSWQRQGVGSQLVQALTELASDHGVGQLRATVLAANTAALAFLRSTTPPALTDHKGTEIDFRIPLAPTEHRIEHRTGRVAA